jgi:hypothetical protein
MVAATGKAFPAGFRICACYRSSAMPEPETHAPVYRPGIAWWRCNQEKFT